MTKPLSLPVGSVAVMYYVSIGLQGWDGLVNRIDGFTEKNRDKLSQALASVMLQSSCALIKYANEKVVRSMRMCYCEWWRKELSDFGSIVFQGSYFKNKSKSRWHAFRWALIADVRGHSNTSNLMSSQICDNGPIHTCSWIVSPRGKYTQLPTGFCSN